MANGTAAAATQGGGLGDLAPFLLGGGLISNIVGAIGQSGQQREAERLLRSAIEQVERELEGAKEFVAGRDLEVAFERSITDLEETLDQSVHSRITQLRESGLPESVVRQAIDQLERERGEVVASARRQGEARLPLLKSQRLPVLRDLQQQRAELDVALSNRAAAQVDPALIVGQGITRLGAQALQSGQQADLLRQLLGQGQGAGQNNTTEAGAPVLQQQQFAIDPQLQQLLFNTPEFRAFQGRGVVGDDPLPVFSAGPSFGNPINQPGAPRFFQFGGF